METFDISKLEFKPFNMLQHESEITEMLEVILSRSEVRNVVEIGTFEGGTAYLWGQIVKPHNGKVYCIDVQFGPGSKAAPQWIERCEPVYRGTEIGERIVEIEGLSQDQKVIEQLVKLLGDRKVDFLFIDGHHTYECAKADFDNYSPFVAAGGWIAFHDIVDKAWSLNEFWEEIKPRYQSWEFIIQRQPEEKRKTSRNPERINGIGLIRWKEKA